MDKQISESINNLMLKISAELNQSIIDVRNHIGENDEYLQYRTAIGNVMGHIFLDVMRPIYESYPDLTPPELK